ncbi:hypothetical protein L1987_19015 [Smallanthus sonchifolius]|uniref:Uncharacterized protein n=1 Tax=Smallanthus sonchifolius TaxID=185202 RepID=A0ACB9J3W4_9ASTR|nr:hypothetical protein L1987_19015 [Smallanthus sonchifolius]
MRIEYDLQSSTNTSALLMDHRTEVSMYDQHMIMDHYAKSSASMLNIRVESYKVQEEEQFDKETSNIDKEDQVPIIEVEDVNMSNQYPFKVKKTTLDPELPITTCEINGIAPNLFYVLKSESRKHEKLTEKKDQKMSEKRLKKSDQKIQKKVQNTKKKIEKKIQKKVDQKSKPQESSSRLSTT